MNTHSGCNTLPARLNRVLPIALSLLILNSATAQDLLDMAARGYNYPEFKTALASVPDFKTIHDANNQTLLHRSAANRHQEGVAILLFAGADVNAKDIKGQTPIFSVLATYDPSAGVRDDLTMILEMLTLKGADLNAQANDGTTPLAVAAETGDLRSAEFLIWRGAALAPVGVPADRVPLIIARKRGDTKMIALLEASALSDVSLEKTSPGHLADSLKRQLSSAARASDLNSVQSLLESGADINQQDEYGITALYRAANDRRADLVVLLLLEGADPNRANKDGKTPLMAVTRLCGMTPQRIFFSLLLAGADVNAVSKDNTTALSQAVNSQMDFYVRWLFWRGANLNVRTPEGSLMQLAMAQVDNPRMIELLKSFGLKEETASPMTPKTAAFNAIRLNDKTKLEEILKSVPANSTDANGRPLIWCATVMKHFDMVDLLLKNGANINQPVVSSGWTALHSIVCNSFDGQETWALQSLKEALKRGANPNATSKDGFTPLMLVAQQGLDPQRMDLLLESGAQINTRNKAGKTALKIALEHGRNDTVKYLKAHSALE